MLQFLRGINEVPCWALLLFGGSIESHLLKGGLTVGVIGAEDGQLCVKRSPIDPH